MIPWLDNGTPLPPPAQALREPNGLLAASTDISATRLLEAYRQGIFPWYSAGQPVLWWSPDPRMVLFPEAFVCARSLRKTLNRIARDTRWQIRIDSDFGGVMQACAASARSGQDGTWITAEIIAAYTGLHQQGLAHSVETWCEDELVGGLYGVSLGRMFFGESMFSRVTDASKIALAYLVFFLRNQGCRMIDCQQNTAHLASLGAHEIPRSDFLQQLKSLIAEPQIIWPAQLHRTF
ncbi:MAG: leucyl/phenylalanyl-tRNA--protein transferase [Burkholderiaceae bacterium]|nr:MAG: leucyl/phenylalanyl-tRNA--protein transferase [Burkholderiaceae bacterium]